MCITAYRTEEALTFECDRLVWHKQYVFSTASRREPTGPARCAAPDASARPGRAAHWLCSELPRLSRCGGPEAARTCGAQGDGPSSDPSVPDESRRSLSFSASAHLQTEAHLFPLPPECSRRWLDYTLHTAMQSMESLSIRSWVCTQGPHPAWAAGLLTFPQSLFYKKPCSGRHACLPACC